MEELMSEEKKELTGYIHSLESFGSVDGPASTICDLCVPDVRCAASFAITRIPGI